jgi:anti-sigma-K factor RskA
LKGRRPPEILVALDLESDTPRLRLVAESERDERRLRLWLLRSPDAIPSLALAVYDLWHELFEEEQRSG